MTPDLYGPIYQKKVVTFFDQLLDPKFAGKPFMRHYLDYYFDIYWDLHLGVKGDAIPAGVRQIGEGFNTVLAYRNPSRQIVYENYMIHRRPSVEQKKSAPLANGADFKDADQDSDVASAGSITASEPQGSERPQPQPLPSGGPTCAAAGGASYATPSKSWVLPPRRRGRERQTDPSERERPSAKGRLRRRGQSRLTSSTSCILPSLTLDFARSEYYDGAVIHTNRTPAFTLR